MRSFFTFLSLAGLALQCQTPFKPSTKVNEIPIDTQNSPNPPLQVLERRNLTYPSASAMAYFPSRTLNHGSNENIDVQKIDPNSTSEIQTQFWILGDDAPNLGILSLDRFQLYQIPLPFHRPTKQAKGTDTLTRWKKKAKLDFEAMAHYFHENQQLHHLFAFGSGSKSPQRDTGLYWNFATGALNPTAYKICLTPLYQVLQRRAQISPETWNIEGACIDTKNEGALYLLQRSPATLIRIRLRDWFRYLEIGSLPNDSNIQVKRYTLPKLDGYEAGFSGACYDAERHSIWFSSSVEITDDPVRDGEILGSFLGEISLSSGEISITPVPIPEVPNSPNKTKLESIQLLNFKHPQIRRFAGTVDNDDGGSQWLLMEWKGIK